jgi:hypothetical protein
VKNILGRSLEKLTASYMAYSKIYFLAGLFFISSAVTAQSLRDSLFAGKLKVDTGKTYASKDTGKYVPSKYSAPKVYNAGTVTSSTDGNKTTSEANKTEIIKPDESMPDSLNKTFYQKQKLWKRFIDVDTPIITQEASDTKKVKKGEYTIEVEYKIGLNGRVSTTGITSTPSNDYLVEQVSELMKRAPVLSPPIYSDGKPRELNAKQTITIIKK